MGGGGFFLGGGGITRVCYILHCRLSKPLSISKEFSWNKYWNDQTPLEKKKGTTRAVYSVNPISVSYYTHCLNICQSLEKCA